MYTNQTKIQIQLVPPEVNWRDFIRLLEPQSKECVFPQLSGSLIYSPGEVYDMITRMCCQVAPAVLEDLLLTHPSIADCCVIGRPDTLAGELPMAFVVVAPGHQLDEQSVKDFVAS
jgi:non-ribosomal peptide synthetase component E (peptide arylation enzyme)